MPIIKSFSPFQNLSNFQVFENDDLPNSEYFRITELKETLTGGKNSFLIEGSEHLKETTEVKIEILDVEGNPIYFEPGDGIPEYYEGISKLISIHVYDDTPIGIGKITILGELKTYIGENGAVTDIPNEWKGVYNVKYERQIQINKNLANETIVRFYKRPTVTISEIVKPIFNKTISNVTATGSLNGFPLQPPTGQKLEEWGAGTTYLLQRTSGSWDVDVNESVINISSLNYSPTIIEVLNNAEIIVNTPYTSSNGNVAAFSDKPFSVTYQDIENETIGETSITGSFAKIDISQLKTFVGDVARVKIFRKSRNAVGDFQFVQEAKLESQELLRDVTTTSDTEIPYGKLTPSVLSNYWVSSSNDHPITIDSTNLSRAAHIDYNTGVGGVQQLITSQSISVVSGDEYTINFKTLLSGSLDDTNKSVKVFLSSSTFTQDFLTASGSAIYRAKQNVSQNIISQNTGDAKLVFEVSGDDWYISNISLRNAQDTSFSPDTFTIIQDIPRKTATETFDFIFEFYDVNNNFIPVEVKATKEFDGGNDFPSSGKLFTFESDRNAFRFSSGSIGNPPFQQIQFKTSQQNLTGSVTYASAAFDVDGTYINPSSYTGTYPGTLTSVTPAGSIITIANFSGSDNTVTVGSIVYTASLGDLEEFETVYRLEDGDNAPQLVVTSDANQFIYEPTTLSPKPSSQCITVRAQRKNLASLVTPITINSGSNKPGLTYVDTSNGIDTYTISATAFSESFASNDFDSVTYQFTGSDVFGNEQSDEITLSKVVNFDAVSIILTNEATSFQAKSTGEILGGLVPSSGSVQMFIGSNQISHDDESGGRNKNTFNITSSVGDNVTPTDTTPNTADYSISAFETAKDSGSLTLTIDYLAGDNTTTQSFEKVVSYTKAKKAVPTVLTKVSPSTQTINSSSVGYDTPQTMEVIVQEGGTEYTFDGSLSGGGDSNAQKFNITGLFVDSGSISNSNEILTYGSLTSSFNSIIGSASLAYVDSEGTYVTDKKVRFDLAVSKIGVDGVNGASGSNAKVVSLSSTRYAVVYDGDGNLFPANQNFTLSGSAQNFDTPEFQFLSGGAVIHDFATTSEVVVSSSGYPAAGTSIIYEVRAKEQLGSYQGVFDNIDVFAVQSGSDAFTVFLTNEAHVFSADSTGTVTSVLADGAFETRFFRGAEQYNFGTSGKSYSVSATSSSIELSQATTGGNQRKFTPTSISGDSGSASITVTDNNTGQTFPKTYTFTKSKKGAPVTTLSASPQAQSVTSGSGGIGDPTNVTIVANEGGSDYTYTTGTVTANEFKITGVTNGTNNNDGTITPTKPTNSTAVEGAVTASYTNSEGTAFTGKTIPFSVGVVGLGDTGPQGADGESSKTVSLAASSFIIAYDSSGANPDVASITLTATSQNFTDAYFKFTGGGSDFTDETSYTDGSGANSDTATFTVPTSYSSTPYTFTVSVQEGSSGGEVASDTITIASVQPGTDGNDGADAYTVLLTNEAHTLPTTNAGTVTYTGSGTSVIVYKGSTELNGITSGTPTAGQFKVTATATNITAGSQTSTGNPVVFADASAILADTAQISFSVNLENSVTVTKIQSFAKSTQGDDGNDGDPGAQGDDGLRTANGIVHYQVSSSSAPSSPSATSYTFSTNAFSGLTSNWGIDAPVYSGSNSAKYWFSRYNVSETTSGGDTGTPSFSSPSQAIGFTGLVTFTANSESIDDGLGNELTFGVNGATVINGSNIATGKIISTNYVTGSGDGFTSTGIEFNLDSSSLAGEKFAIKPDGSARFSGDVVGSTIGGGTINVPATSPLFTVTSAGQLSAVNAELSGSINAQSGEIGGWKIGSSTLYSPTTGQIRMSLAGGSNPNITAMDSSGNENVVINSGTSLSSLGAGSATVNNGTYNQKTTTLSTPPASTGTSFSNTDLDPGEGNSAINVYANSVPVGNFTVTAQLQFPQTTGWAAKFTSTNYDTGGATLNSIYHYVKVGFYVSTSSSPYTTKSAITNNALYISPTEKLIQQTENSPGSTTTHYLPWNNQSSSYSFTLGGTVWNNTSVQTVYFHTYTYNYYLNALSVNSSHLIDWDVQIQNPKFNSITLSSNVSRTELCGGGLQVVSSTDNYVLMERQTGGGLSANSVMLDVGGSIEATGNITANASDERLKNILGLIENPLDKIKQLKGIRFNWNEIAKELANHKTDEEHIGLIAQDVQKVLPQIVKQSPIGKHKDENYLTIWYEKLVPLLVESIKELSEKVDKLEEDNNKLKDGN